MSVDDTNDLTMFYIVEPPRYQMLACYLLASIRTHFPSDVKVVGYCPEHAYDKLHPGVHIAHEKMGAEIRTFVSKDTFEPAYPHGNKILAAREPRDTAYSMFLDSDILFIRDNTPANIIKQGHVSCAMSASMHWAGQQIWDVIYGALDMPIPPERYTLMRDNLLGKRRRGPLIPYFNSGLVAFPEQDQGQGRFADVWYETAQIVDRVETLENRRPYLDQMTLPAAIRRAGLDWNILPPEQNFLLGGYLRGKPLPKDHEIFTLHYRRIRNLTSAGHLKTAYRYLKRKTGKRYPARLRLPPPEPINSSTAE